MSVRLSVRLSVHTPSSSISQWISNLSTSGDSLGHGGLNKTIWEEIGAETKKKACLLFLLSMFVRPTIMFVRPSMFVCPTIMFFHSSMFVLPRILRKILGTSSSRRARKMPPKVAVLRVSKKCQHVKKGKKILPAFLLE